MSNKQTADYINNFFTSLTKEYPKVKDEWLSFGKQDPLPPITAESVARMLCNLDVNKAPGPFDPNMKLIKIFAEYFAVPLSDIYNQSFRCKIFAETWKISNVCSVPKSNPCSLVEELRPIALTSILSKIQESYAVEWILNDTNDKINEFQFGGLAGMSAVLALIFQLHKWYLAMENTRKIVRITFLDFRKAFDLIDHNRLLQNFNDIGVRPGLIGWFASYLQGRSQMTTFHGVKSERMEINGGIPQGSKLGPVAFIIKINQLPSVTNWNSAETTNQDGIDEGETVMFMDDTTLSEVIETSGHTSGTLIGNTQENVNNVALFARHERMQLNVKKCKEMIIDFRKNKTTIPPIKIGDQPIARVKSYKLLGIWLDDDMKWSTNTEYITKKAAKRLYLLKILKNYGASKNDLKSFYCAVIRSTLEYGAQVWHGNLTQEQCNNIERIQKRALRIIHPEYEYNEALKESKLKPLKERRNDLCIDLIKNMLQPTHKLHGLLPDKHSNIKMRETRANNNKIYNFFSRTERFKCSPLVYSIDRYNESMDS